ncbi:hypothetical protein [Poriferisphaera sp. WC338]|uniref:hypothetical protein n=1 Tax=Poriferisphaera sp. WC338 TaxID=3425129 RepID=UPI003D81B676
MVKVKAYLSATALRFCLPLLTVIGSASIAPHALWAADPLASFYEYTPLVTDQQQWSLEKQTVRVSPNGKHIAGVAVHAIDFTGYALIHDGTTHHYGLAKPVFSFQPQTDQVHALFSDNRQWFKRVNHRTLDERHYQPEGDIIFSSNGKHMAYVGIEDLKRYVLLDDKAADGPFQKIDRDSIKFTADGHVLTYRAMSDGIWRIYINGRSDSRWMQIGNKIFTAQQGGDVFYHARRGDKWHIIRVGRTNQRDQVWGGYINLKNNIHFSGNGKHAAWWAQSKPGWWDLYVNGKAISACRTRTPGDIALSHDGSAIAATHQTVGSTTWRAVVNGQPLDEPFDAIASGSLRLSASGKHLAFGIKQDGHWKLYLDGKILGQTTGLLKNGLILSETGRIAYAGRDLLGKWRVWDAKDGITRRSEAYDGINPGSLQFSPIIPGTNAHRLAYIANIDNRDVAVVDGVMLGMRSKITRLVFSPNAKHVAFIGSRIDKKQLIINGKPASAPFHDLAPGGKIVFGNDGAVLVMVEQKPGKYGRIDAHLAPTPTTSEMAQVIE